MPTKAAAVVPTSFTSFPSPSPLLITLTFTIWLLQGGKGEGGGEQHKLTNQKTENRNQKTENHESCYRCDLSSEPFRHMKQYPSTLLSWSLSTCLSLSGTFVVINAVIKLEPPVKWPSWQISISISLSISSIQWVDVPIVWPSASQTTWVCLSFNCYRHAAHLISSCRISTLYSPPPSFSSLFVRLISAWKCCRSRSIIGLDYFTISVGVSFTCFSFPLSPSFSVSLFSEGLN